MSGSRTRTRTMLYGYSLLYVLLYTLCLQYLTCNQLYQINFRLSFKKSYLIYKLYCTSIVCVKHASFVNHVHHKKEHLSETKTRYTSTKYVLHKAKFKALDCPSFGVLSFTL